MNVKKTVKKIIALGTGATMVGATILGAPAGSARTSRPHPGTRSGCAGVPGLTMTARLCAALVPQLFEAVTVMFPFSPAAPEVTVMEVVPCPAVMVHPVGTVQV